MSAITERSQVTLHFSLAVIRDQNEELVDSTFDKQPATFVMGDGSLLPGFEKCLLGMVAADKSTFMLEPVDAFGEPNPQSILKLEKKRFNKMELPEGGLVEGLVLSFDGAGKRPMPGIVKAIGDDEVMVDFNHPLAGCPIRFDVEILAVEEAGPRQTIAVSAS